MEITYLAIEEKHYEELIELWEHIPGVKVRKDDDKEGFLRLLHRNEGCSFLAMYDGKIVGSILCGIDGKRAYVYHMAVNPEYRNQKIGTRLVRMVQDKAKEFGVAKCSFVVFKENHTGEEFWEAVGAVKRTDLDYYDLEV